jgi:hypothetical protein
MTQMARNAVDEESGYLRRHSYVLHDRDTKFCADFRNTLASGGVKCLRLPPRSPNLNPFVEQRISSMRTANGPCLQVKYSATVADLNEAGFRAADVASSV